MADRSGPVLPPALARLAQLTHEHLAEREREYEAAVKLAAVREWAALQERIAAIVCNDVREILDFAGVYMPAPRQDWEAGKPPIRSWRIKATPRGLPPDILLVFTGEFIRSAKGEELTLALLDVPYAAPRVVLSPVQTAEEQLAALGAVLIPELERQQRQREEEAARERLQRQREAAWQAQRQREEEERRQIDAAFAAARERLAARIPAARARLEAQRAADLAARGWPPGARLVCYRLRWIAGHQDDDGEPFLYEWYSPAAAPDADGWWPVFQRDGIRRLRIESPYGYICEELVITDPAQLPASWMWKEHSYAEELSEELPAEISRLSGWTCVTERVELAPVPLLHPDLAAFLQRPHRPAGGPTGAGSAGNAGGAHPGEAGDARGAGGAGGAGSSLLPARQQP